MRRIEDHPILGPAQKGPIVHITVDGREIEACEGESVASALLAAGIHIFRRTRRFSEPRAVFCGIGQCNDCIMEVDGIPNVRTCVTPVKEGMKIRTLEQKC